MLDNIEVLKHSSIRISKDKIIYFDPFEIKTKYNDADIIFITHSHYDHFSIDDIKKVVGKSTILVVPQSMKDDIKDIKNIFKQVIYVNIYENYKIDNIEFSVVPSYNINKSFHPKSNNWVGYIVEINNIKYYIAGDADKNSDIEKIKCDVAFLPIGGTYTMDYIEAANLTNLIKPKIVVPIHYGSIVGNINMGYNFSKLISNDIKCIIMIK